jgi:hypothetical protein
MPSHGCASFAGPRSIRGRACVCWGRVVTSIATHLLWPQFNRRAGRYPGSKVPDRVDRRDPRGRRTRNPSLVRGRTMLRARRPPLGDRSNLGERGPGKTHAPAPQDRSSRPARVHRLYQFPPFRRSVGRVGGNRRGRSSRRPEGGGQHVGHRSCLDRRGSGLLWALHLRHQQGGSSLEGASGGGSARLDASVRGLRGAVPGDGPASPLT